MAGVGAKAKAVSEQLLEQKEALIDLRNEIVTYSGTFARTLGTVGKSLAGLKEEKQEQARTLRFLRQNDEDKGKVEKDLRAGIAEKQAEIRRLSSELAKARQAEKSAIERLDAQQGANVALERRLEESARSETEARRRLSISESSSASASRKEVLSLSSLVEANKSEVERLREELDLQSKSHSLRIAELQESFQAKIKELRRKHAEQAAASRASLEDEIRAGLADDSAASLSLVTRERDDLRLEVKDLGYELNELKGHTSQVEKKLDEIERQQADARRKAHLLEKQNRQLSAEAEAHKASAASAKEAGELREANEALGAELARVKAELAAKSKEVAKGAGQGQGGDLAMLDVMEQQLVKLSGLLSSKEEEIEALKETVERECWERNNLIAELSRRPK